MVFKNVLSQAYGKYGHEYMEHNICRRSIGLGEGMKKEDKYGGGENDGILHERRRKKTCLRNDVIISNWEKRARRTSLNLYRSRFKQ